MLLLQVFGLVVGIEASAHFLHLQLPNELLIHQVLSLSELICEGLSVD